VNIVISSAIYGINACNPADPTHGYSGENCCLKKQQYKTNCNRVIKPCSPEHAMAVFEKEHEMIIRYQIMIGEMQCGFRPGKGTSDDICIIRQLQEKCQAKNNLHFTFVALEVFAGVISQR
jgi:hypothetical protein